MSVPQKDLTQAAPAPVDPRVGSVLAERYRIDELLGEGGMGKVYAAEHVLMRKRLAVKVLHRELTTVPEVVKRFEREAMAAANIEHPNVAAATDFGKLPDGAVFLVLEYVLGRNLRDVIAEAPLPVARALHIARQIASALASAHALKIVHRDLKPENVMLVEKGGDVDFVKVLDFGIAKVPIGEVSESGRPPAPGSAITKVGMVFGTPEYMAPEQALGQIVDGRADLYALGVILYEMIAGVRPYSSHSPVGILGQQLSKPVPSFAERAVGVEVPADVERLVMRLLEREADARFQRADEVAEAIDGVAGMSRPGRRRFRTEGSLSDGRSSQAALDVRGSRTSFADRSPPPGSAVVPTPGLATAVADPSAPAEGLPWDNSADPPLSFVGAPAELPIPPVPAAPSPGPPQAAPPSGERVPTRRAAPRFSSAGARVQALTGRLRERGADLRHHALSTVQVAESWLDAQRPRLPQKLRGPLERVSARAMLLVSSAIIVALVLVVALLVTGAGSSKGDAGEPAVAKTDPPAPAKSPLELAREQGIPALEKLAQVEPKSTEVAVALAEAHTRAGHPERAVRSLTELVKANPEVKADPRLYSQLRVTAATKVGLAPTLQLLERDLGSPGADFIYELALAKDVPDATRQRAEQWLKTNAFQRNSSPGLNIAVALRHSTTCSQRHALLLRARNVGDARSLPYLQSWTSRSGCGADKRQDCHPCLRSDRLLEQAISAIEKRQTSLPPR